MERLDTDVGAVKPALQQTPEVFKGVGVNLSVYVGDRMVDDLVGVLALQPVIRLQFIAVERRSRLYVFLDFCLKGFLSAVINHHGTDFPSALQNPHDRNLSPWFPFR